MKHHATSHIGIGAKVTGGSVVMQHNNLKVIMTKNGVVFARECPISVYEGDGKTIPARRIPTRPLAMDNVPQLKVVVPEVADTMMNLMKEAAASQ